MSNFFKVSRKNSLEDKEINFLPFVYSKKKTLKAQKFDGKDSTRMSLNLEPEEGGEGVCFEAACSLEGRFYPGPGSRNEVS